MVRELLARTTMRLGWADCSAAWAHGLGTWSLVHEVTGGDTRSRSGRWIRVVPGMMRSEAARDDRGRLARGDDVDPLKTTVVQDRESDWHGPDVGMLTQKRLVRLLRAAHCSRSDRITLRGERFAGAPLMCLSVGRSARRRRRRTGVLAELVLIDESLDGLAVEALWRGAAWNELAERRWTTFLTYFIASKCLEADTPPSLRMLEVAFSTVKLLRRLLL